MGPLSCRFGFPLTAWLIGVFSGVAEVVERVWGAVGRSRGFTGVLIQMQRQAERDAKARVAAQRRAQVEADRALRAFERATVADQKERARLYIESRVAEVAALNDGLAVDITALDALMHDTLAVDDFLDFESLKEAVPRPPFAPGALAEPEPPPDPPASGRPHRAGRKNLFPVPDSVTWHVSRLGASSTMRPFRRISSGKPNG